MKGIIYSDLDGTILDAERYTWYPAKAGFHWAKEEGIDIVLNTSKTWREVEEWRECFELDTPAIVENGGAVVLSDHHSFAHQSGQRSLGSFRIQEIGTPIHAFFSTFERIRNEGDFHCQAVIEMSTEEFASKTGLDHEEAENALDREFTIPVEFYGNKARRQEFISWCSGSELSVHEGGSFIHLQKDCDKGTAVRWLTKQYRNEYDTCFTAAVGDRPNDLPMFREVDYAFAVQNPDETHDEQFQSSHGPEIDLIDEIGPAGWSEAVARFLDVLEEEHSF